MRGDHLARQWRVLGTIESRKHGAIVAKLAPEEGYPTRTVWSDLSASRTSVVPMDSETDAQETTWGFVHAIRLQKPQKQKLAGLARY